MTALHPFSSVRPAHGRAARASAEAAAPRASAPVAFEPAVLDRLADGVYTVDLSRTITWWSRGAERLTGFAPADVVGRRCYDNLLDHLGADGASLCRGSCPLAASMSDGAAREVRAWLRGRDGARRPVRVQTAALYAPRGGVIGGLEVVGDAVGPGGGTTLDGSRPPVGLIEPMTGMPNRRFLNSLVAARFEDLERRGTPFALMLVDIDHFSAVNARFGRDAGDSALCTLAATITGAARPGDVAASLGGPLFAVLASDLDAAAAAALGERVRLLVAATVLGSLQGRPIVTASVGVAAARSGEAGSGLSRRAETALCAAKIAGRNRVVAHGGQPVHALAAGPK